MRNLASTAQKNYILSLNQMLGFDRKIINFDHIRCGVKKEWTGESLDSWLSQLNISEASFVIQKMKKEHAENSGEEDEEEDQDSDEWQTRVDKFEELNFR